METEHKRRWRAIWRDQRGNLQEELFYAPDNRGLARIDFQLHLLEMQLPCPHTFELEEADFPLEQPRLPHLQGTRRISQR
jgi:hypothetical protein